MTDSGSAAVHRTVTSPEYQPAALAGVVAVPERVGAVVSPAGTVTEVVEVLPAASVALPPTVVPGGTVVTFVAVPSAKQLAMPEPPLPVLGSMHVKVTVVVPLAFVVCPAVIVGAALSTRTVTAPVPPHMRDGLLACGWNGEDPAAETLRLQTG